MYIPIQDTIVCEQANRRPDVIRQIIYEDEEQVRPDLRPIPGARGIALGLDLRLGHLKQLVQCDFNKILYAHRDHNTLLAMFVP